MCTNNYSNKERFDKNNMVQFFNLTVYIQSGREKNAQRLVHRHSATVCSRIMWFSPKCSEKITVYDSLSDDE